ncbi:MAG: hypothetical protein Q7O66_17465 [Dehalococcoidia bacterium]|nr:hypothetical protein [Dehalococcoidia bacterium]
MQVQNGAVWQAQKPLQELLNAPWPVKTAYALARLGRKINNEYGVIDQVRVKLIKQYGTTDDKGQTSILPACPEWEQFAAAFNELMAQEVEIPLEKIVLPDIEISISPNSLISLEPFIEMA